MIVDKKFYNVKCDCCGALFNETYWDEVEGATCMLDDCGWKALEPDKHYCPDCYEWDDDHHLVTKDGRKWDECGYEIKDDNK